MALPPEEIISAAILWDVLDNPLDYPWRAHGIGMLRTYLDSEQNWRLNLWHTRLLNPGISTMHTHPWALHSYILCGALENTRWQRTGNGPVARDFYEGRVGCGNRPFNGPEFKIEGVPDIVRLSMMTPELYRHGDEYQQHPAVIHSTRTGDGAATVMHRTDPTEDGMASVFWPVGEEWGDASRDTTEEDVLITVEAVKAELQATPWRR